MAISTKQLKQLAKLAQARKTVSDLESKLPKQLVDMPAEVLTFLAGGIGAAERLDDDDERRKTAADAMHTFLTATPTVKAVENGKEIVRKGQRPLAMRQAAEEELKIGLHKLDIDSILKSDKRFKMIGEGQTKRWTLTK